MSVRDKPKLVVGAAEREMFEGGEREIRYSHYDEDSADNDALDAAAEDGVGNDGERLVDDHVRQQKSDEQQVSVFANRLDLVCVRLLVAGQRMSAPYLRRARGMWRLTAYR